MQKEILFDHGDGFAMLGLLSCLPFSKGRTTLITKFSSRFSKIYENKVRGISDQN